MQCPVCSSELVQKDEVFVCPKGHGTLMAGKLLGELKQLNIPDETPTSQTQVDANKPLVCPHCSAQMQKVNYNDSGIIIDACTNCAYRWLAAGEIKKIEDYKPSIHPQDLLFLEGLKEKTDAVAASETQEDTENPDVPLYSGGWGGLIRGGWAAGNDNRTLGWILGAGMYGLIVGIIKSKVVRVIAPFVILGFIILGYLIYKQVRIDFPLKH
jgi:Zn-finger nucleic acid-binding protein